MSLTWEKRDGQLFSSDGRWRITGKWPDYRLHHRYSDGRSGWSTVSGSNPGRPFIPSRFGTMAEAKAYAAGASVDGSTPTTPPPPEGWQVVHDGTLIARDADLRVFVNGEWRGATVDVSHRPGPVRSHRRVYVTYFHKGQRIGVRVAVGRIAVRTPEESD